jgi:hypothetical protein
MSNAGVSDKSSYFTDNSSGRGSTAKDITDKEASQLSPATNRRSIEHTLSAATTQEARKKTNTEYVTAVTSMPDIAQSKDDLSRGAK